MRHARSNLCANRHARRGSTGCGGHAAAGAKARVRTHSSSGLISRSGGESRKFMVRLAYPPFGEEALTGSQARAPRRGGVTTASAVCTNTPKSFRQVRPSRYSTYPRSLAGCSTCR